MSKDTRENLELALEQHLDKHGISYTSEVHSDGSHVFANIDGSGLAARVNIYGAQYILYWLNADNTVEHVCYHPTGVVGWVRQERDDAIVDHRVYLLAAFRGTLNHGYKDDDVHFVTCEHLQNAVQEEESRGYICPACKAVTCWCSGSDATPLCDDCACEIEDNCA